MKRDMELLRKILIAIEEQSDGTWIDNLQIDGYNDRQIAYHCKLLYDGGYISDCKIQYADDDMSFFGVGRLTWDGHEFLDKVKSETVWNRTKDIIVKGGLPVAIDVIKGVTSGVVEGMVKAAMNKM